MSTELTVNMQSAAYQSGVNDANAIIDDSLPPASLRVEAQLAEAMTGIAMSQDTLDMHAGFATTIRDYLAERSDV